MATETISVQERRQDALRTAAGWRAAAEADNPAGPLYSSGAFAEVDMIAGDSAHTAGPACTILYACSPQTGCC
jgi:hypothetical protein